MVLQYKYSCVKSNMTILSILITSFFENFIAGILIIFTPSQNSSNIHPSSLFSQHCSPFKNISSIICDAYILLTVQPSNRVWWSYTRSHTLNKTCNSFCQQPPITKNTSTGDGQPHVYFPSSCNDFVWLELAQDLCTLSLPL